MIGFAQTPGRAEVDRTAQTQFPGDIEQKLMDGQRLRAIHDLMVRHGVVLPQTRAWFTLGSAWRVSCCH